MAKPKTLLYVETLKNTSSGSFYKKGGGKYTILEHARKAKKDIERRGGEAKIFITECNWVEVE